MDVSPLGNATRTPQGGLRVPAYLTRTGVFTYRKADGSEYKELRLPEEVFSDRALGTFSGAPVTVRHPSEPVTPENWRQYSVGHVSEGVRKDGRFAGADVIIQDAAAIKDIEAGTLREISCGYECDVDPTPGIYNGERYDAVQRNIVGNHVALGPRNWGRAGGEVGLRLDSSESAYTVDDMTVSLAEHEALKGQLAAAQARIDEMTAQLAPEALDARVKARADFLGNVRVVLGKDTKLDGKSDRELMSQVVASVFSKVRLDGKESDAYLAGMFASAVASYVPAVAALGALNAASAPPPAAERVDAAGAAVGSAVVEVDGVEAKRLEMIDRNRNAWKGAK